MCKTIKQKVKFQIHPRVIYDFFTDAKKLKTLTGKSASFKKQVGTSFSLLAGQISGVVVDLAPEKRIVQAWRAKNFPDGIFSMATIVLTKTKRGGTELVLTHRGVPKHLIPAVETQWRLRFWANIKRLCQ